MAFSGFDLALNSTEMLPATSIPNVVAQSGVGTRQLAWGEWPYIARPFARRPATDSTPRRTAVDLLKVTIGRTDLSSSASRPGGRSGVGDAHRSHAGTRGRAARID